MPAQTHLFLCLKDNYGVLLHDPESGATAAIDAPEAAPVEAALKATGWRLTDILVTHHHADHTGGIAELKEQPPLPRGRSRTARRRAFRWSTRPCARTTRFGSAALEARVLETPGHTAGHISYVFPADKLAFVGDTLFSIGCGRVIEGTPEMMWQSLLEAARPAGRHPHLLRPRIHAGQYPLRAHHRARQRGAGRAGEGGGEARRRARRRPIPSTLGEEKAANPFLRADVPEVAKSVGLAGKPAWKVFAEIRERKNRS